MPHTESAKKRLRQVAKRTAHNRVVKKKIKLQLKTFLATVKTGTLEQLQTEYNKSAQLLDRYATRGVLHRNKAARKKSQLAKTLRDKKAAPPAAPATN
jgi:small subunit ribosomal protein S20